MYIRIHVCKLPKGLGEHKHLFFCWYHGNFFLYDKVTERNGVESPELNQLVHRLKAVISRVARLIEIMEFDPNALSASMLNLSGDEASEWIHKLSSSHTPYILNRLQTHSEITEG